MNRDNNEILTAISKFWKWEADWMTCRACKRHLIASRDGEPFVHADGCVNIGLVHPWRSLRLALTTDTPASFDANGSPVPMVGQNFIPPSDETGESHG